MKKENFFIIFSIIFHTNAPKTAQSKYPTPELIPFKVKGLRKGVNKIQQLWQNKTEDKIQQNMTTMTKWNKMQQDTSKYDNIR